MTPNDFRRIAIAHQDATEGAHMGHPDFRIRGRIFATIHSDARHGMVKLTPDQQERFIHDYSDTFAPESGAWGRAGCTRVMIETVADEVLGEAMTLAWQNAIAQASTPSKRNRPKAPSRRGVRSDRQAGVCR